MPAVGNTVLNCGHMIDAAIHGKVMEFREILCIEYYHSFKEVNRISGNQFHLQDLTPISSMHVHLHTSSPQWFTTPSMMMVAVADAAAFFRIET